MRFNLYHACAMAAVLAFSTTNAIALHQNEEAELAECFDADYDFAEIEAEVDADLEHCPKPSACPCGAGACPNKSPDSDYEAGVKAKVQSALWDAHGNGKLGGHKVVQGAPAGGCGCGGAGATGGCQSLGHYTCDKAMKIIMDAQNAACKANKNRISPEKQRAIEELRKKIEDKNKEIIKVRDDTSKKIDDMRKDANSKQKKEEMKGLVNDFSALKGTMQKLIKQKKGDDALGSKLTEDLSKHHGEIKSLKGHVQKTKDACCCPEGIDKAKALYGAGRGDGYDDDADYENGCAVSTLVLRQRARDALAMLNAREQEHCAMCKSRLTCGSGPACPCGTPNPCGGESLQMRKECDNHECAAKGAEGEPKTKGQVNCGTDKKETEEKPRNVQVRVKADGEGATSAEVLSDKPATE